MKDIRWAPVLIKTAGDLKQLLQNVPNETPIVRLTAGYYTINKQDVHIWLGKLPIGFEEEVQDCLRF